MNLFPKEVVAVADGGSSAGSSCVTSKASLSEEGSSGTGAIIERSASHEKDVDTSNPS